MNNWWHQIFPHGGMLLSDTMQRLILAAVLGGLIGLEREFKQRPAGLRTNMFICFGAAMFTILSEKIVDPSVPDKSRIASNIITGIGFIGAGSILHSRGGVQGLTTAATIFVVASIGMAAGGGFFPEAIFATLLILVALYGLGYFETRFNLKPISLTYEAHGDKADDMLADINKVLEEEHRIMDALQVSNRGSGFVAHFRLLATRHDHDLLMARMRAFPSIKLVSILRRREEDVGA